MSFVAPAGGGKPIRFGSFSIRPEDRVLQGSGREIALTPKAFETLMVLLNRSNQVVRREELFEAVWPGVVVEENNLTQQISILRKTLGDEDGVLIETIPRIGYRLNISRQDSAFKARLLRYRYWIAAGLILVTIPTASLLLRGEPSAVTEIKSIAVLPFTNQSPNQDEAYLGFAISEALIHRFSAVKGLSTRPASTMSRYLDQPAPPVTAGRQLRVQSVLTGTVHRTGTDIRVTARLMRVDDGRILWSGRFRRRSAQLFDVPDDIMAAVARELRLDSGRPTEQPREAPAVAAAYEEHMKGRYLFSRRTTADMEKSVVFFQRAVELDPNYAAAWADLGTSLVWTGRRPEGREASDRALELDESLAEARAGRALEYLVEDYNFELARQEFERAGQSDPNNAKVHHWYAYYFAVIGDTDKALQQMAMARRLDPASLIIQTDIGEILYLGRRFDEAIRQLEQVLQLDPLFAQAHAKLAAAYQAVGRYDDAVGHARRFVALDPGAEHEVFLARVLAVAGKTAEARRTLGNPGARAGGEYSIAEAFAALGEKDRAFEWLEAAYRNRHAGVALMKVNPAMDPLREDPRFDELLMRLGLAGS